MIVNQEKDSWTQHTDIHIVEGETIEFPVNFDDSKPLLESEVSLAMYRDGNVLQNLFKRIQLTKHSHYHMLSLVGLEVGDYTLITKFCANEFQSISITVHKGQYWEGNFILKKNCIFQSYAQKQMIRIDEVKHTAGDESTLRVQLNNFSDNSRVHVFAQQFQPNFCDSLRDVIEDGVSNAINTANFPFAIWRNMFESNSVIGDEIRYVFDRQRKENKMGNTLDRPTLLMNKTFVRNTQTTEEQITAGTQYQARDLG